MKDACVIITLLLCPLALCEAPMFRGDLQHSGVYNAADISTAPAIKWKFHTNGRVFSSPAVEDGMAYVGSTDNYLYAVRTEDGALKWKFEAQSRVTASPAVANGVVYFGSFDGSFYAVDAMTGKVKWKFQSGGERRFAAKHIHGIQPAAETMPDPFDFFLSSPALWDGRVYFGSGDGNVYALDAETGRVKWKFQTGDVVHASPAIANGTLFIGSWDTYFYALDATTGAEKWRFKTGEDSEIHNQVGIQSSAAVMDGLVFFGCRDSNLYGLDANTGEKKWSFSNKGSWVIGSPAVRDGKVYFTTSDSGLFHAVNARDGTPIFSLKLIWPMFSSPAIAGNTLYVGSHEGKLFAIDLSSQKLAWTFQTDGSRRNGAELTKPDGGPNYKAAFAGNFYDDIISGLDKMFTVGAVLSSPVVVHNIIYFGSADGNLYALGAQTSGPASRGSGD